MKSSNYAIERILHELDFWSFQLEYFETAFGGEPDRHNVKICENKIEELNKYLADYME